MTENQQAGGAMEKYRVDLADEERAVLKGLLGKGRVAARKLAHARVLLLADAGHDDAAIAAAVAVSTRTVNRVRKRLVTEGFLAALDHKPQPPRPDKIKVKGDVEQQLVRIACSDPPEGRRHWTLQLLADELVALGLVQKVSTETVRQALKKTISSHGWSRPGASRPTPTASTSGTWRT
jgi:hypothetical protein